ncbi:SGNH/GDSL hydrolase family protein [Hazenella sp. IB182357]|uniref:SGNH/GDSL hydrolase family protein n=1 Tax=Polycladospora coralii TaxID=2771432 RepID=A0A926NAD5_9BACL|nr:SGNH/GDSL hydrolase family protein [Polycladospora coralii]MBS7530864.1 SGNH/GDSL hydrolase family protein [Polycladospora coralii]
MRGGIPIYYTALGDSITAGVGAAPGKSFPQLLSSHMSTYLNTTVNLFRVSRKGWQTPNLYFALRHLPNKRKIFSQSNLITLCIGGNDLALGFFKYRYFTKDPSTLDEILAEFLQSYTAIIRLVQHYTQTPLYLLNLYNPYPSDPIATHFVISYNQVIATTASHFSFPLVNLFTKFSHHEADYIHGYKDGHTHQMIPFLRSNPIHPNPKGHYVIAKEVWQTYRNKDGMTKQTNCDLYSS